MVWRRRLPWEVARLGLLGAGAAATAVFGFLFSNIAHDMWAARYLAMNGKRRLVGSFWHGSMANAMAQAIGA